MSSTIRFDDRVALVTGAGRGLGRSYALALAARGAAVVVNDPGVSMGGHEADGRGPADDVVAEIHAAGGRAVADYGNVTDPAACEAMVKRAIDSFGAIDILVNNAGTNRRYPFPETTRDDFRAIMDVHLFGTFYVTQAAWSHMAAQRRGRIVFTTSQVAFYGKYDAVAYGAAKAGIIGLMHGLKLSSDPVGVTVNCISPFAMTRFSPNFPKEIAAGIDPSQVAAAVVLLCADDCPLSSEILIAGGGHFALARTFETHGIDIDDPTAVSAEALRARLGEIGDFTDPLVYPDAIKAVDVTFDRVKQRAAKGGPPPTRR